MSRSDRRWVVIVHGKRQLWFVSTDLSYVNSKDDAYLFKNEADAKSMMMSFLERGIVANTIEA